MLVIGSVKYYRGEKSENEKKNFKEKEKQEKLATLEQYDHF